METEYNPNEIPRVDVTTEKIEDALEDVKDLKNLLDLLENGVKESKLTEEQLSDLKKSISKIIEISNALI